MSLVLIANKKMTTMHQIEIRPDITSVLSTLIGIIQKESTRVDQFLQQLGKPDPLQEKFWDSRGIRRMILDNMYYKPGMTDITTILSNCSIIEFADWAAMNNVSCWDKLYSDAVKPLKKRDFQFIFHLGDVSGRLVFEIDEVLDIIGDFSSCGQTTLILDTHEADALWCKLNGRNPGTIQSVCVPSTARERYLFLFNTMSIDSLVILYGSGALHLSREGQFDLAGKPPVSIGGVINARHRFSAGYQMGLLLQLDPPHCMALGLAISGGYPEPLPAWGSALLIKYTQDWLTQVN
jgi:hypothetical protein